jgi:hypothetical protein
MIRRNFIRIAGGGVVAGALAAGTSGCGLSGDFPAVALEAWKGPAIDAELRRWALSYAILAPNSHNRQPWLVDLAEPQAITLYVDRERMLPMTDPWFRQIIVSQGTFLESLVMALRERGVEPKVQLFPEGEFKPREVDERPVARISWDAKPGQPAAHKDVLFAQLLLRHTAKIDYDTTRTVPASVLAALQSAYADDSVKFGGTLDAAALEPLRAICWESAKVELGTSRTVMESLQLTRVGPAEIAHYRDGISVNAVVPRLAAAIGAFDRSRPPALGGTAYQQMMSRFEGHSKTAMGFVWLSTATAKHLKAGTGRSAEVNAGRAYLRLHLKATELGLQIHPMSQAPQEFPEMKPFYDQLHMQLVGKPAIEETVQMFCRIGYCAPQQHSPRRSLAGFVKA